MGTKVYKNDFSASVKSLCIYSIYLHTPTLPRYILHHIGSLKKIGYETIIVSHSEINAEGLEELEKICCGIIGKDNFGYDFFAWREGLSICGDLSNLDHLLLTNDSVIGPFNDMSGIFESMNEKYDFWGLTENYEHKYHIQSYFIHANKKVINHSSWIKFWTDLKIFQDKLDIVRHYEVNLTQSLAQNPNLRIGAWIQTKDLADKLSPSWFGDYPRTEFWHGVSNPTVRFWKELLLYFKFPFIKKNLFSGKEHYHVNQDSHTYEYKVFPVNWKKTVEKAFTPAAVSLIEEYITDYNLNTSTFEYHVPEKYKLLFVYERFKESAQVDYLLRLLQFFNGRNIETEVLVSSGEDLLDETFRSALGDLTRLTFFSDLSSRQAEIHKHQLATEKIGGIFLGDITAMEFASKFAYIGCPYVLMINQSISDLEDLQRKGVDIQQEGLHLMTHSKRINEWLTQKGLRSALIEFIPSPKAPAEPPAVIASAEPPDTTAPAPSFNLGLIGLRAFEAHYEQIASLADSLRSGEDLSISLLFSVPEYELVKELLKKNKETYHAFLTDGRIKIVVYKDLRETLRHTPVDLFLSYLKPGYTPDDYITILSENIPMLAFFKGNMHEEIFGNAFREFTLEYFNVPGVVENISLLKKDRDRFRRLAALQWEAFKKYTDTLRPDDPEKFFFSRVIDFTELKSRAPKITVIFHFHFYSFDNSTFQYYKKRLREFYKPNISFLFSITEGSYDIPKHVKSLQHTFPGSIVKIVPHKGRDIGAKFLLFDFFLCQGGEAEYLVVLHDKKSLHLPYWEARAWIDSLLKIVEPANYNHITGSFSAEKKTGIIGTAERITDNILRYESNGTIRKPVFEWNNDLLHQMIALFNIRIADYNFVGGTMFWVRGKLLKELNEKYCFLDQYVKLEEGNVMDNNGSTITHCWERLFCWLSTNAGYQVGSV
jgi:lipopolysaccharide biosynthesis protein